MCRFGFVRSRRYQYQGTHLPALPVMRLALLPQNEISCSHHLRYHRFGAILQCCRVVRPLQSLYHFVRGIFRCHKPCNHLKEESTLLRGCSLRLFRLLFYLFISLQSQLVFLTWVIRSDNHVPFFEFLHDVTSLFVFLLIIYKLVITHHSHYIPFFTRVENIAYAMKIGRIMNNNSTIFISIYIISRRYFLASFNSPDFTTRDCYSDFLPILKWLGRNKVNRAAAYRREFDSHCFAVFTINKPQQPMGRNVPLHYSLNLSAHLCHPLSFHCGLVGNHNAVSFVFHHKQVVIHAVLIEISVTLRMLTRSKQVDAVHFRFRHNGSTINDDPVQRKTCCCKSAREVVF